MKRLVVVLVLAVLGACAMSHTLDATDGGVSSDGATFEDGHVATSDGGADAHGGDGVVCGPNRCRADEICCNATCGVCTFPTECVDHGCH